MTGDPETTCTTKVRRGKERGRGEREETNRFRTGVSFQLEVRVEGVPRRDLMRSDVILEEGDSKVSSVLY